MQFVTALLQWLVDSGGAILDLIVTACVVIA